MYLDILQLPGVMYLDRRTNLAIHVGNFSCIKYGLYTGGGGGEGEGLSYKT